MITTHNEMLKTDRMNPARYTKRNFKKPLRPMEMGTAKAMSSMKKKNP